MKKAIYLIVGLAFILEKNATGQKPAFELIFTAQYQGQYVPMDSIAIENLTQGGDTMLYAPDTILVLDYTTGITANPALSPGSFRLSQNRPNPFNDETTISIFLPLSDRLQLCVSNLLGQKVAFFEKSMEAGNHSFVFYSGDDKYYFLTATFNGLTKAIKMLSLNSFSGKTCSLIYERSDETPEGYKSILEINNFEYSLGDQLRFTGFAKSPMNITGSDVIEAAPQGNESYIFEIIEGIPCPGISTITFEGQTYKTVQIGFQCWFKENLSVGIMINTSTNQTNNNQIEKYCYNNDPVNCATYGGLYQWDEMMQYITTPGVQGICPEGWHLPTDAEWTSLSDFLAGEYIAGGKMKEVDTLHWNSPNIGATNESGFTALPGGFRDYVYMFNNMGISADFWTSTESVSSYAWYRELVHSITTIIRFNFGKINSFSVRCLKN